MNPTFDVSVATDNMLAPPGLVIDGDTLEPISPQKPTEDENGMEYAPPFVGEEVFRPWLELVESYAAQSECQWSQYSWPLIHPYGFQSTSEWLGWHSVDQQ